MKLNLLIDNPDDVRSGYVNIDPFAEPCDPHGRVKGALHDLGHTVDDGEASEIVANDVLDYHPGAVLDDVLNNWLKKLARGGTLTVSTVDVREVARLVWFGNVDINEANNLLHGEQKKEWQLRKVSLSLPHLVEVLEAKGFKVLQKRIHNLRAVVTVQRP